MKKSSENKDVHLLYKKVGETPKEAILRYKRDNLECDHLNMTYAGRLDPMAEGLLLVLSGEEILNKDKFLALPKTYEFEILWGFETDTADLLGLSVESRKLKVTSRIPKTVEIKKQLKKSVGKFKQLYPIYSSRPVGGKSLFEWAREGRISEIDIPRHEVEIFSAKFLERREIKPIKLLEDILGKVDLVSGDFRQKEIKKSWQKAIKVPPQEMSKTVFDINTFSRKNMSKTVFDMLTVDSIEMEVSSGFYVRQFVTDLARSLGEIAVTYCINRLKIGDFNVDS